MAVDFDDIKETVKAIALRLDSPSSNYSFVFSESDEAVEVRVEMGKSLEPFFVFSVDAERFRVLKDLEINPEGYASFPYHNYVELLSFILQYFYPAFFKINNGVSIADMLSRVLKEKIRIWKDVLRVICKAGDVEYYDFGGSFSVLSVNFSYNSETYELDISGEFEEHKKIPSVMELTVTLLTVLGYIFEREELDVNPILGSQLLEQSESEMQDEQETMDLEAEIDGMGGGGDMPEGEDLSSEFVPSGDSAESTAPDLASGKDEILQSVGSSASIRSSADLSYTQLLEVSDHVTLIDSGYSLFGSLEPFSEAVRKIVPKEAGEPDMDVWPEKKIGQLSFSFNLNGEFVWLAFTCSLSGNGYVSLCNGESHIMYFNSIGELESSFPIWYSGLQGVNNE